MSLNAKALLEAVTAIGSLSCLAFYGLSMCGVASFLKERKRLHQQPRSPHTPGISILKPLKGIDPAMWDGFRSHCEQHYPEYELIFGVSDPADPAIAFVKRLQQEYPHRNIQLVVADQLLGANTKVSTLAQMLPSARYEILFVNDSDIRVDPDYLPRIVAPLADSSTGLVTCLYRGIAARSLGSRLEALGISTDFAPGVLSARFIERTLRFGLGSTLAFRRNDLAAIGGFEALADYLADDYELGRRIASLGRLVELSDVVVETFLPEYSFGGFLAHQLRWSRTIRDARRWGYVGLLFTFGLPWAIAMLLAAGGAAWAWLLFALVLAARLTVALLTSLAVLHDRRILRDLFLLPLRDLLAPIVWAISFAGNQISWRGERFSLKSGRLERIPQTATKT